MKTNVKTGKLFIEIVCLLYILLLVYAAMNKGLDFENFKVELAQSPLLSAFADWISWTVVIIEFGIAVFLLFPKTRIKALYAGFCLMTMFTAYIFIMLNYSSYLPCSCGGILEKMSWEQHLIFNLFFVVLGAAALSIHHNQQRKSDTLEVTLASPLKLLLTFAVFISAVIILFACSEEIMQYKNPFIRRYPHHPASLIKTLDLKYNSYYLAGYGNEKLYLGNLTAPLSVLVIDNKMIPQTIKVSLDRDRFLFKSIKITVNPPYFFIIDGSTPAIFRGKTTDWKANLLTPNPPYFNIGFPVDSTTIVFRGISSKTNNNIMGLFRFGEKSNTKMLPQLLQKQTDGVFDTDGMLHYSPEMKRIIYLYSYRNEYIAADTNGVLDFRAHTIDTFSHAKIKVSYLKGKTERAMASPAVNVNKSSSVSGHLLFVNSNVPGRYEQKEVWQQASVIDVYDLTKKTYLSSFHIYGINEKKVRSFMVTPEYVYALIENKLLVYKLNENLKDEINRVSENHN